MAGSGGEQAVGMQLNQYPADPGGGGSTGGGQKDLASSPAEKQAAANAIEKNIEPHTRTAGAWADDETDSVVKAFGAKDGHGWLTSGAVSTTHKTWGESVQTLMTRLAGDKGALRGSNTVLTGTDTGIGGGLLKPSPITAY
ncbi:hypothetical protein ACIRU3_01855 [Streptomyces sp. NPDC101151]|uniref:hypothetical protein n=1 Tax=Streptomyces sp. NPDC101151 TaxID=3366115 RepID=UPI00381784B3